MRKLYFAILSIFLIPLIFPIFVKAAPPTSANELITWYHSFGVYGLDSQITNLWNDNQYNISNKAYGILQYNGTGTEQLTIFYCPYATDYVASYDSGQHNYAITKNNVWGNTYAYNQISCVYNYTDQTYTSLDSSISRAGWVRYYSGNQPVIHFSWEEPPIDYDNPIYSSAIPTPEMTVTYTGIGLNLPTNQNGVYVDCIVPSEDAFYIQLQAKYSCADMVQINLNNGVISYDYLDWTAGDAIDIYSLHDNQSSVHVTAQDFQDTWDSVIDALADNSSFPQFISNVPFWVQNPSAQKYLDAQSRYKNVLMRQAPLYGSRMELFARYYAIVDNSVYVGKWIHWNSANPSNTEELGNSYQVDQPFPGFQNTSNNNNLPDQDDTYTNFGENTSVNQNPYSQVIINNNVPNYPDYPTAVSYNHDNILVQFITTAKQLPNFFGDVGTFLTASFTFIPSEIWLLVGFGFMCSIVVMIIKVL